MVALISVRLDSSMTSFTPSIASLVSVLHQSQNGDSSYRISFISAGIAIGDIFSISIDVQKFNKIRQEYAFREPHAETVHVVGMPTMI